MTEVLRSAAAGLRSGAGGNDGQRLLHGLRETEGARPSRLTPPQDGSIKLPDLTAIVISPPHGCTR